MSDARRLLTLVLNIEDEVNSLKKLLGPATQAQWMKSPRPPADDDAEGRQKGTHTDPTGDTAVDEDRLQLRQGVRHAERTLLHTLAALRRSRRGLASGYRAWEGHEVE